MDINKSTVAVTGVVIVLIVLGLLLPSIAYVIDQREMAVVLQFGKPVVERTEPGIYFKLPLVQEVLKLPSTRQFWGNNPNFPLSDLPTKDDKKIEIVPWAIWRVKQPTTFVKTLVTMDEAERRVSEFVRGAIRDVITQYDLAEIVRSTDRALTTTGSLGIEVEQATQEELTPGKKKKVKLDIEIGRPAILAKIKNEARRRLTSKAQGEEGRGIELIDVGISQIDFVQSVQTKTFDRWIAEREAIAALNINEGKRMQQEIINQAKSNVQRIEGEGQQRANEIRGKVDAEIIRKFAVAIERTGDFYNFARTLETYRNAIHADTKIILTTDSDLFGLLKELTPAKESASKAEVPQ